MKYINIDIDGEKYEISINDDDQNCELYKKLLTNGVYLGDFANPGKAFSYLLQHEESFNSKKQY